MAFKVQNSPFLQKVGDDIIQFNLETIASQVKYSYSENSDTVNTNLDAEVTSLRSRVKAIEQFNAGNGKVFVVDDITARDALESPNIGDICWVKDASADTTVDAGAAQYIWDGTVWVKTAEAESMDLVIDWSDIQNKPSSTVAEIDDAVDKKHEHDNKAVLDKLTYTNGALNYDNVPVGGSFYTPAVDGKTYAETVADMNVPDGAIILITEAAGA